MKLFSSKVRRYAHTFGYRNVRVWKVLGMVIWKKRI